MRGLEFGDLVELPTGEWMVVISRDYSLRRLTAHITETRREAYEWAQSQGRYTLPFMPAEVISPRIKQLELERDTYRNGLELLREELKQIQIRFQDNGQDQEDPPWRLK